MTAPAVLATRVPRRRLRDLLPVVHGTSCRLCGYEVPALGLDPDAEMAWFERFEDRPCPQCCGVALGVVAGAALALLARRHDTHRVPRPRA